MPAKNGTIICCNFSCTVSECNPPSSQTQWVIGITEYPAVLMKISKGILQSTFLAKQLTNTTQRKRLITTDKCTFFQNCKNEMRWRENSNLLDLFYKTYRKAGKGATDEGHIGAKKSKKNAKMVGIAPFFVSHFRMTWEGMEQGRWQHASLENIKVRPCNYISHSITPFTVF